MDNNKGIVFSTEHGQMCPDCKKERDKCICSKKSVHSRENDGIVRLQRQTKGRKGKGVTLITGLPLNEDQMKKLAKELKNKCGCGGTVKNGNIEIQNSDREKLAELLSGKGYKTKIAGG